MASISKSAISKRTIDISHLEREIKQDVASYRQYKAEDGMKKRAIHASKDYDEFRNFVSVSQLKPTSGRDVSNLFTGASGLLATGSRSKQIQRGHATIGGFDDIIQRRKDSSATTSSTPIARLDGNLQSLSIGELSTSKSKAESGTRAKKSSREVHDFLREWKQCCTTAKDTLSFLARIKDIDGSFQNQLVLQPAVTCTEYFSTDIDSDVVGNIVEALHLLCMKTDGDSLAIATANGSAGDWRDASGVPHLLSSRYNLLSFTHSWLKNLPSCGRFELSVSFLMPHQQQKLKEVCNFLKKSNGDEGKSANEKYLIQYDFLLK
mmetsp:Transcript_1028/g.2279  ORF Transcript_1028/g.2279 Transcript_1028/m.2279 type:complete len:321 (+) Transcript_1028:137-1099(+)